MAQTNPKSAATSIIASKPTYNELKKNLEEIEKKAGDLQQREAAINEREEKCRTILQSIADSYFEIDLKGHLLFINEATLHITGFTREQLLGMNYLQFCTQESREKIQQILSKIQQLGTSIRGVEFGLICADGQKRDMEMSVSLLRGTSGQPTGFCGMARNINERKQSEEMFQTTNHQLEESNRDLERMIERANQMAVKAELVNLELNQIFNTAADGMWEIDAQFQVQRINSTLAGMLGISPEKAIRQKCSDLFEGPICHSGKCPLKQMLNNLGMDRIELDIERTMTDGSVIPFILTATRFRGPDGEFMGIVEAFKNISERKRAEEAIQKANLELERLARIDGLTQVANRRTFDESLDREWRRLWREQKPLALIMCDVDCFKAYNDTYGHQLGDDCLRAIAQAINRNAKRPADVVARYGGEEFAVILPNTSGLGAVHVAESIRQSVMELKLAHSQSAAGKYVTLSLGVANIIPAAHFKPQSLIEAADKALYEAKKNGRNQFVLKDISGA
jgi:diguanylate cyclase (GGDEF)-like protein/PAS domain S-box-containing protein